MRKFKADIVFPVHSDPISDGIIIADDDGRIIEVVDGRQFNDMSDVEVYSGALIPGLINSHCHLELAPLQQKEFNGIPDFITSMINNTNNKFQSSYSLFSSMRQLYDSGTVFIADHCNSDISFQVKTQSKIRTHSFIEVIGLKTEEADTILIKNKRLCELAKSLDLSASLAIHSPYSVSQKLINLVLHNALDYNEFMSIHNQESSAEDQLFIYGNGLLKNVIASFNYAIHSIEKSGESSFLTYFKQVELKLKALFIHNIYSSDKDIHRMAMFNSSAAVICPRSNVKIESKIADIEKFELNNIPILIGTDSLASSESISIYDDLFFLCERYQMSFQHVLKFATINPAFFFGIDKQFGSFEKNKKPGIVFVSSFDERMKKPTFNSLTKRIL